MQASCFILNALSILFLSFSEPVLLLSLITERCLSPLLLAFLLLVKSLHLLAVFVLISLPCFFLSFDSVFSLSFVPFMCSSTVFFVFSRFLLFEPSDFLSFKEILLVDLLCMSDSPFFIHVCLFVILLLLLEPSKLVHLLLLPFLFFLVFLTLLLTLLVLLFLLTFSFTIPFPLLLFFTTESCIIFVHLLKFIASNVIFTILALAFTFLHVFMFFTLLLELFGKFLLSPLSFLFFTLL